MCNVTYEGNQVAQEVRLADGETDVAFVLERDDMHVEVSFCPRRISPAS